MAKYEEPTNRVIGNHQGQEIRYYQPYLVAEVTVEGSFSSAGNGYSLACVAHLALNAGEQEFNN